MKDIKKIKKPLKMAIVEDSKPYLNLLAMFIKQICSEESIEIDIDLFDNPVDYKINRDYYDIVILDYVFRQYTYGANGFYLAKLTKDRLPNAYTIINSSYGLSEISDMLREFKEYIDAYSHKESDMYESDSGLLSIVQEIIIKLWTK